MEFERIWSGRDSMAAGSGRVQNLRQGTIVKSGAWDRSGAAEAAPDYYVHFLLLRWAPPRPCLMVRRRLVASRRRRLSLARSQRPHTGHRSFSAGGTRTRRLAGHARRSLSLTRTTERFESKMVARSVFAFLTASKQRHLHAPALPPAPPSILQRTRPSAHDRHSSVGSPYWCAEIPALTVA